MQLKPSKCQFWPFWAFFGPSERQWAGLSDRMGVFHGPFGSHTWPPGVGNRRHFVFSTRNKRLKPAKRLFLAIFFYPFGLFQGLLKGWKKVFSTKPFGFHSRSIWGSRRAPEQEKLRKILTPPLFPLCIVHCAVYIALCAVCIVYCASCIMHAADRDPTHGSSAEQRTSIPLKALSHAPINKQSTANE